MGSYSHLYINNFPVLSSKNSVVGEIMTIFRESDKSVYKRKVSDRNIYAWGEIKDDGEVETVYEYTNSVENIIQRLEIMGFTLRAVEQELNKGIESIIEEYQEFNEHVENIYQDNIRVLENSNCQSFIKACEEIQINKLIPNYYFSESRCNSISPLVQYIIDNVQDDLVNNDSDILLRLPCFDFRASLRIFLESCPKYSFVTQDITDLVHSGYCSPDERVCQMAVDNLFKDFDINSKIIVLTEGASDREILSRSLKILYPHLFEYYSFMDYGISNAAGGASALVSQIKSFVGAGIENRIIAVFDNDTAAYVAVRGLKKTELTRNIVIMHYPKNKLAVNYPTIGPTGISEMDINELAGGIEIYLGKEILNISGQLTPVHWKGFDSTINKYQGELIEKSSIQKRFFEKIGVCEKEPGKISDYDWDGIRSILNAIFNAFNK